MEADGAIDMFLNSSDMHNLQIHYIRRWWWFELVRLCIWNTRKINGSDYPFKKEDSIGHIQESIGTASRKYKNKM